VIQKSAVVCSVDTLKWWDGLNLIIESFVDNSTVGDLWLLGWVIASGQSVLHPGVVETLSEVVSSVGSARLLSILSSVHGHLGLDHEVLEFHGLDEVGIPDAAAIFDADVSNSLRELVEGLAASLKVVLSAEDSSVLLHGLLHVKTDLGSRLRAS
jgi:hypothetical protein